MIGKTVLHYKIIEKLGEGGMGVVYLAEDTKLDRQVAIKFLPPHISANSDERKRFEIEAKALFELENGLKIYPDNGEILEWIGFVKRRQG